MESIPLGMDDLFGDNDEEENYPGALADLPEELEPSQPGEQNDFQNAENDEVLSKLKDLSKGAAKKTVRRPIPKLDSTRLTGERGIPIVPKVFENIKLKGKGHEMQDLKCIMDKLEHWSHRLFPKLPFDEVLARTEKLGNKKEVQTCIKKMRLDMPILAADFVGTEEDKEEEPEVNNETINKEKEKQDMGAEEAFDEIIRQDASQKSTQDVVSPVKTQAMLSEEQKQRMEKNKQMALEKRLARLSQTPNLKGNHSPMTPDTSDTPTVSTKKSEGSVLHNDGERDDTTKNGDIVDQMTNVASSSQENSSAIDPSKATVDKSANPDISANPDEQAGDDSTSLLSYEQKTDDQPSKPVTDTEEGSLQNKDKNTTDKSDDILPDIGVNKQDNRPTNELNKDATMETDKSDNILPDAGVNEQDNRPTNELNNDVTMETDKSDNIMPDDGVNGNNKTELNNDVTMETKQSDNILPDDGVNKQDNTTKRNNDVTMETKQCDSMVTDDQQTVEELLDDLEDV